MKWFAVLQISLVIAMTIKTVARRQYEGKALRNKIAERFLRESGVVISLASVWKSVKS
jgi:hypothetical protein